ncbi:hypothetical protein FLP41_02005 (plasmid) [Paracoccus marcusii]|uniref:hypothetical protein n=1 Tax=Paracoccus marcusii TaxID=59779 RepID=UPI002ED23A1C|nr:hypothetical protein FLP41_02005 [Paracoccus marcusii]
MSDTITLAPFASEHLPAALALSRAEAWPHRAEDWALLVAQPGPRRAGGWPGRGTALLTRFGPVGW